ncbi:DnaD domain protein [Spiroplasma eriocheiris]|uniref:Chromosome replication initiation and membrane attachment protein n=1 Tax=Spiroplasma eriocheiris TaxID=315358 RepID=A0A0H3XLZ5_9MOLU|nr:DnaD domain protein [Spiroplasma eriocheiris]AHF58167.1 chromosome replication initiation/membrane attachment protein [Spiroplasma eriocheiris CCTCC M 207170]AKM54604.1 chromosome replication initiation and membrane attachment protein [Spiroplasma eriocheiris]
MKIESEVTYLVKRDYDLTNYDRLIVLYLYRPIIGHQAHALYLMLVYDDIELDINTKYGSEHFLAILQMTYDELIKAKHQLETIGLLKVLKREKGTHYILKPQLPITPDAFFSNPVLCSYLSDKLGHQNFLLIKDKFLKNDKYIDITSESTVLQNPNLLLNIDFIYIDKYLAGKNANSKLYLPYKDKIVQLVNYYHILTKDIANFIYQAISVENKTRIFSYHKFQMLLSDFYQKETLKKQVNGEQLNLIIDEENVVSPSSMKEAKIKEMATIDPIEYLTLLRDNVRPTPIEIDIIRDLILNYQLKNGVVNCLIEYVWFKNNKRIERSYCEKIANTFNQLKITTVKKAMDHLKEAYVKSQRAKTTKNAIKTNSQVTRSFNQDLKASEIKNLEYVQLYEQSKPDFSGEKIDDKQLIEELKNL